jgi:hypothetical protein
VDVTGFDPFKECDISSIGFADPYDDFTYELVEHV